MQKNSIENYLAVRTKVSDLWRACLDVLAATGWHVRELRRSAAAGAIEPMPQGRTDGAKVLVCPEHKSGEPIKTAVSEEAAEAAKKLLENGSFSETWLRRAIHEAYDALGVPRFNPGSFRHTVATMAVNRGTPLGIEAPRPPGSSTPLMRR